MNQLHCDTLHHTSTSAIATATTAAYMQDINH